MPQLKEYYHDVDLKANQLFNSRLHNITTAARTALGIGLTTNDKGYMVYDTDLSSPYFWDGVQWNAAGGGGGTWGSITGTLTAQTDLINYRSTNYTPQSRTLTINGTTYDLSADRSWTVSGLPSQATHNGQWLTTDGTNASWSALSGNVSLFTNDANYITSAALSGYVPYTGATADVDLGIYSLATSEAITNLVSATIGSDLNIKTTYVSTSGSLEFVGGSQEIATVDITNLHLENGDYIMAAKEKDRLEVKQRADKK